MDTVNSGTIGGAFGLLEMSTRMSIRDYSVRQMGENGRMYERFYSTAGAAAEVAQSFGQNTIYRNILVNDSWMITALIHTPKHGDWEQYFDAVDGAGGYKKLLFKDTIRAMNFLDSVLKNGDCKKKLEGLLAEFHKISGIAPLTTDLTDLFAQLKSQNKGGITLNVPQTSNLNVLIRQQMNADFGNIFEAGNRETEPRGLTSRMPWGNMRVGGKNIATNGAAYLLLQDTGFSADTGSYAAAQQLAKNLIHELLHLAAGSGLYEHDSPTFQEAAKKLGSSSINEYIEKHCKPKIK